MITVDDMEKCFHYLLHVRFPCDAVPVAVQTLHGSTCNDICRVTTISTKSPERAAEAAPLPPPAEYFFKSCRGVKRGEILLEAGGLALLQRSGLPVPPVVLAGEVDGTAFLAEAFIRKGNGSVPDWPHKRDEAAAGRALASLHRHRSADGRFGCRRVAASLNIGEVEVPEALQAALSRTTSLSAPGVASSSSCDTSAAAAAEAYTSTFVWSASWPELYLQDLLQPHVTRAQQRGLWSAERQKMFDVFAERFRAHFATRAYLAAEADSEGDGCAFVSASATASLNTSNSPRDTRGVVADDEGESCAMAAEKAASVTACSLLHGDLWGGNLLFDISGSPVFIDPQPLYGDREMDIAMTHFFGGFGPDFYAAYEAAYPLDEDADMRVPWYQLYYAMMHLNLFGEAYGRAVEEALQAV